MNADETVADVIVVGGGGAGLAAAIEAASLGRRVILLEKNPAVYPIDPDLGIAEHTGFTQ